MAKQLIIKDNNDDDNGDDEDKEGLASKERSNEGSALSRAKMIMTMMKKTKGLTRKKGPQGKDDDDDDDDGGSSKEGRERIAASSHSPAVTHTGSSTAGLSLAFAKCTTVRTAQSGLINVCTTTLYSAL